MSATPSDNNSPAIDLGLTESSGGLDVPAAESTADAAGLLPNGAITEQYLVDGMTCGHCVSSVTEELSTLDGVHSVTVDLNAGGTSRVTVISDRPVPTESVRAAVTEAGYDLVDA